MLGRPINRGRRLTEYSHKSLRTVVDLCCFQRTRPFHVEGDLRADGEYRRNRWIRKTQSLGERVGKIVIVEEIHVAHSQPRTPAVEVNFDSVVSHRDHPEHVIAIDVHIVVVNLIGQSNRTGVQVKSNKGKRSSVYAAVGTDEFTLTESHIGLVRKRS